MISYHLVFYFNTTKNAPAFSLTVPTGKKNFVGIRKSKGADRYLQYAEETKL